MGCSITPLATSMLAMLCERPMHCYEMYRLMLDRREDRIVKVKPGSLYHTMDRLHAAGFVEATGTDRDGGRPERTTYAITPAGRAAMDTWIRGVLAEPVAEYPWFPLALGESHNLPRADVLALLRKRIEHLDAGLAADERLVDDAVTRGVSELHLLDAYYLFATRRAESDWLRELVRRVENEELTWPTA